MRDRNESFAAFQEMEKVAKRAKIFVSMPAIEGITPRILFDSERSKEVATDEPFPRRHGIFEPDEVGIPFFDHSILYGDGCFEGILIQRRSIFLHREHMQRWWRSADMISIDFPYSMEDLGTEIWSVAKEVGFSSDEKGYLRPVVTRGIGDLGINPKKCVGPTVFVIASTIKLYPEEKYQTGIGLGLTRQQRRPSAKFIDPRIKSNNYLNNVLGLLEGTSGTKYVESLMLSEEGFISEATVDNLFLVIRNPGWEEDPSKVQVQTPVDRYCLRGITRDTIITFAKEEGFNVEEKADMVPLDLIGDDRECFMTGTGAGIMPVVEVIGKPIGDGKPGPITKKLRGKILRAMEDPDWGISLDVSENEVRSYLSSEGITATMGSAG